MNMPRKSGKRRGSLTVEATLILPFVLISWLTIINLLNIYYMQTCIQGYDDFGFDRLVLIDAYLKCGEEHHEGK